MERERLSERKKMILRAIIDAHIDKGEPVGSKYLTQNKAIAFSSATIRNEMAELEQMGYLEQPHTSAGRVPSELGYRFYVESLMEEYRLTRDELDQLNGIAKNKEAELDGIIEQAGKLFSKLTNYTSIAVKPKTAKSVITRFDTVFIDCHSFVLVMVMSTGTAKTKLIRTDVMIDTVLTDRLSGILNRHLAGISADRIAYSVIPEMKKELFDFEALVEPIVKCIYDTVTETDKGDVKVEGVGRLLSYPEYSDMSKLSGLIGMLEQKEDILNIISNSEKDMVNIFIGSENASEEMSNSTLIFKTITSDDKVIGAIGVIGPCRMDYSKVVTTLEMLTKNISEMFSKGTNILPDKLNGGKDD